MAKKEEDVLITNLGPSNKTVSQIVSCCLIVP